MQTIELGQTGQDVSRMALGAMQMGGRTGERDSIHILDRYLEVLDVEPPAGQQECGGQPDRAGPHHDHRGVGQRRFGGGDTAEHDTRDEDDDDGDCHPQPAGHRPSSMWHALSPLSREANEPCRGWATQDP